MQSLPFSIQSFSKLRKSNCLYVDKTKYAYDLIMQEQSFFLSRPRRFGKSLFVSTLEEILKGNQGLFQELWIDQSDYTWPVYGVISLDLSPVKSSTSQTVEHSLCQMLLGIANQYHLSLELDSLHSNMALITLVKALHAKFGKVALLIDEYDYPVLQTLHMPQFSEVLATLQSFFATMKSLDQYINFLFITGVSCFAKSNIFSGMNNLDNISLNPQFATLCGFAEEEMNLYFSSYFKSLAGKKEIPLKDLQAEMKDRYNGYHFGKEVPAVYNPFSVIKALHSEDLQNFWFGSGTPTFLIAEMKKAYHKKMYDVFHFEEFKMGEEESEFFDKAAISLPALLFQTGYLTVKGCKKGEYVLGFPNLDVKMALQKHLLSLLVKLDFTIASQLSRDLAASLNDEEIESAIVCLQELFIHVPLKLQIQEEKFYHSLLQIAFESCGVKIATKNATSKGTVDFILDLPSLIYIIKVKFNQSAKEALTQMEEEKRYEPFLEQDKPIRLLALSFTRTTEKQRKSQFSISFKTKLLGE